MPLQNATNTIHPDFQFPKDKLEADLQLSPEFTDYAWVQRESLEDYSLNSATIETFRQAGIL